MSLKSRHFDPITIPAEAGRRRVHRIACSQCPTTADVSANTQGGSRAHEDLFKIWKRGGWVIGSNPDRDLCPNCQPARRSPRDPSPINATVIPMPAASSLTPDAPRLPTFDEKRLINSKLEEVYVDEKAGYGLGLTDKKVAEDLGIPRKWVEDQREANFGPVRQNDEIRAAFEDASRLQGETRKALADAKGEALRMRSVADILDKNSGELERRLIEIDKRLAAIDKAVR